MPCISKTRLDALYHQYNHPHWIHPDPLEYVFKYDEPADRDLVAFIAASLAYGRVNQILKSVSIVLERMGPSPQDYIQTIDQRSLTRHFEQFRHRFTSTEDLVALLTGIRQVIREFGSLYECFICGYSKSDENILPALSFLVKELDVRDDRSNSLLPIPEKGSACKRLNLFLRWMVRRDNVDPGGWQGVSPEKLVIPLDTHMHKIALLLNITRRKSADMRTALEITHAFKRVEPRDPVRYDFPLTRLGIRSDADIRLLRNDRALFT